MVLCVYVNRYWPLREYKSINNGVIHQQVNYIFQT